MGKLLTLMLVVLAFTAYAGEEDALFSGRVSRLNKEASLMRLRVDFENMKFLNREDKVEFWHEQHPYRRCQGMVEAKSNRYVLIKIKHYAQCMPKIGLNVGSLLFFQSGDLQKTVKMARELLDILAKKRFALETKKRRFYEELSRYVEKVEVINKRYDLLREKLELEWSKELTLLEEDKTETIKQYKDVEARLREVELKSEKYRVHDQSLKEDRWSLDPSLYQKK